MAGFINLSSRERHAMWAWKGKEKKTTVRDERDLGQGKKNIAGKTYSPGKAIRTGKPVDYMEERPVKSGGGGSIKCRGRKTRLKYSLSFKDDWGNVGQGRKATHTGKKCRKGRGVRGITP